jgi:hypothetical protein
MHVKNEARGYGVCRKIHQIRGFPLFLLDSFILSQRGLQIFPSKGGMWGANEVRRLVKK